MIDSSILSFPTPTNGFAQKFFILFLFFLRLIYTSFVFCISVQRGLTHSNGNRSEVESIFVLSVLIRTTQTTTHYQSTSWNQSIIIIFFLPAPILTTFYLIVQIFPNFFLNFFEFFFWIFKFF